VQSTPLHGQLLWYPLHLLNSLATYPLLFAYLFDLMRPGMVRLRYWATVYTPVAALVALHFIFGALHEPLPLFARYAEMRRYLDEPELWVRFAAALFFAVMTGIHFAKTAGLLRQHKNDLKSNFSYTEGITLGWIWWCLSLALLKIIALFLVMSVEGVMIKTVCMAIFYRRACYYNNTGIAAKSTLR
jgi:hypothetical protein